MNRVEEPSVLLSEPPAPAAAPVSFPPPLPPPLPTTEETRRFLPIGAEVYRSENRAMTYGEWWRMLPGPKVLFGWWAKLLSQDTFSGGRVLRIRDQRHVEVSSEELPAEARESVLTRVRQFTALGFADPRFVYFIEPFGQIEIVAAHLILPGEGMIARIFWCRSRVLPTAKPDQSAMVYAIGEAGLQFMAQNKRRIFDQPANAFGESLPGATPERLVAALRALIAKQGVQSMLRPTNTVEEGWQLVNQIEESAFEWGIKRGRYVALTADELAADQAKISGTSLSPADARLAEVRRQVEILRTKSGSSWAGMIVLVITFSVSLAAGMKAWSWRGGLIIIGVLFIHELGHYLAMRWFGYRNLRMFFVPLLGAAVTGRHYNVPGWKKAMVSLAGPVPGIFLSVPLAVLSAWWNQADLAHAALMLAVINTINLAPMLPLDGGSFWNVVLFCRNRWFEMAFRVLAGLALLGISVASGSKFWMYLGIATFVAMPTTLMLGNVTEKVRQRGVSPHAGDDDAVPPATSQTIIEEIDVATKGKLPPKTLAAHCLQVFDQLNSRPPNWLETFGLGTVYGVSGIAGLLTIIVVSVSMLGNNEFRRQMAEGSGRKAETALLEVKPKKPALNAVHPISVAEIETVSAREEDDTPAPRQLVAQFADDTAARGAFAALKSELEPREEASRIGETVLIYTPSRRSPHGGVLTAKLGELGAKSVSDSKQEDGGWPAFDLAATLPDGQAGRDLRDALAGWSHADVAARPPAPWRVPEAQRSAAIRALVTYERALKVRNGVESDPEVQRLQNSTTQRSLWAILRRKPMTSAWKELGAARKAARHRAIQALIDQQDPTLDERILKHLLNEPSFEAGKWQDRRGWERELGRLLGAESNESEDDEKEWTYALVDGADAQLKLRGLNFGRATRDFPELIQFLVKAGCIDLRYGRSARATDELEE